MKKCLVLEPISASMPFHMALDELLYRYHQSDDCDLQLEGFNRDDKNPLLRFYTSDTPWVSIGYPYPLKDEEKGDVPICRRITGGGWVDHGNDLIFALIAHKKDRVSFGSVCPSYREIHEAVHGGYERLGVSPDFFEGDENYLPGQNCFEQPIPSDLQINKQKIAGGAQKRSRGTLLHQESLKVDFSHQTMLIRAFEEAIVSRFGWQVESIALPDAWRQRAIQLAEEKYLDLRCQRIES